MILVESYILSPSTTYIYLRADIWNADDMNADAMNAGKPPNHLVQLSGVHDRSN